MRYKVTTIVAVIVVLAISAYAVGNCDGAGNCYVANMATGTGTGADWANACTDFTGACDVTSSSLRGTTIYVAGTIGNMDSGVYGQFYTAQTFSAPDSGTSLISIIGASAENHGTDTGWNKLYALGQIIFTGPITISTDYWTFNGQFRAVNDNQTESQGGGTYHDHYMGYRMQVINTNGAANAVTVSGSHVTLEYLNIQSAGLGNKQLTSTGTYGQAISDNGLVYTAGVTNEYFGHSWIDFTGADSVHASSGSNFTFEYNMFTKNHMGSAAAASSAITIGDINGLIIRYNHFHDITGQAIITDSQADGTAFTPNWYIYGNDVFWDTVIHTGTNYGLANGILNLTGETLNGGVIHVYNNTFAGLNVAACTTVQSCNSYALNMNGAVGGTCAAHTRNCIGSSAPVGTVYNNLWWNPYRAANITTLAGGSPEWTPTGDYGESVCATTGCTNSGTFTSVGANDTAVTTGLPFTSFNAVMGTVQWYNFNFLPTANTAAGLAIPGASTTPAGCSLNCENIDPNFVTAGANGSIQRGAFQINNRVLKSITMSTAAYGKQTNTLVLSVHVGSTVTPLPICTWSAAPLQDNCPNGAAPFTQVWSSIDKTVATVNSSTGVITGVSPHNDFVRLYYGGLNSNNDLGVVVTDGLGTKPIATLPTGIVRTGSPLAFSSYDTTTFDSNFPTTFSDPCPVNNPPTCTRWTGLTTADQVINAINSSNPGDTIVLTAGTTYNLPGTSQAAFFLPARSNPSHKWTYIVSSAMSSLPAQGTRVSPNDASNMPTINETTGAAFIPQIGADHWWIAGMNVQANAGSTPPCTSTTFPPTVGEVLISAPGLNVIGATLPDSITIDRSYFHILTGDMGHTVEISANHFAILDSYIGPGRQCVTQAQSVAGVYSNGPIKFINNFFSALGEDFIFGGAGGQSSSYVFADAYIKNNTFFKDPAWRAVGYSVAPGITYQVENNTEFKMCQRCLIDGNQYFNNWVSGQNGNSWVWNTFTSYQQGPNSVNDDITFSNNISIGDLQGTAGTEIGTIGEGCDWGLSVCQYPSEARRINQFNNLTILGPQGAPGGRAQNSAITLAAEIQRVGTDWLFQHNTLVGPYLTDYAKCDGSFYIERFSNADPGTSNLWLLDNVMCRQAYGATTAAQGTPFLQDMMVDPTSVPYTTRFFGNVMQTFPGDSVGTWPTGSTTATSFTYVSPTTGNFQLSSPSWSGSNTSDGQQAGINYTVLMAHQHAALGSCSISGTASGVISSGVLITSSGNSQVTQTIETQADGTYTMANLPFGVYILTPAAFAPYPSAAVSYSFSPVNTTVTLSSGSCTSTGNNFVSSAASTYSISGTITSGGTGLASVLVTLSGASSGTTTTNGSGAFTFTGLLPGTYTLTPSLSGYSFTPTSLSQTIVASNLTGANFTATSSSFSISGTVSGAVTSGVTMTLSGTSSGTTTTGGGGTYTFSSRINGTYTVTPSLAGYTFTPANRAVTINGANVTGVNFTATANTYSISGTISGAATGGVTMSLTGTSIATITTASDGTYSFNNLTNGTYTITPTLTGYSFSPVSQTISVNGASVIDINFTASALPPPTHLIAGTVSGDIVSGVIMSLSGTSTASTTTNGSGNYTFNNLADGPYVVTPSASGFIFEPTSLSITLSGANSTGNNFISVIKPTWRFPAVCPHPAVCP